MVHGAEDAVTSLAFSMWVSQQTVIKPVTAVGCLAYEDVGRCGMMVFTDKSWQQDEHSDNKAAGRPAEHQRINAFDFSRAIEWTESAHEGVLGCSSG